MGANASPWNRYYTLSTIIGFLALAYGSVPLYKMVRSRESSHVMLNSAEAYAGV